MKKFFGILAVIVVLMVVKYPPKFLFESATLVDDYFPPKENVDGTVDYVVGFRVKKEHEANYWILRFPKTQLVRLPEANKSVDVQLPNGVGYNLKSFPNSSLLIYLKLPDFSPWPAGTNILEFQDVNYLKLQAHSSASNFNWTNDTFFTRNLKGCTPAGKMGAQVELFKAADDKIHCFVGNVGSDTQTGYRILTTDGKHLAAINCWDSGLGICYGTVELRAMDRAVDFSFPASAIEKADYLRIVNFISDYISRSTVRIDIVPPGKTFQWDATTK